MNIGDLNAGMNDVKLKAKVNEVSDTRTVNTKYGTRSVADAVLSDGTGTIKLSLWGDQISKVKAGDEVEVAGAYVKEWNGELQLGVGKTGELKVL